MEIQKRRGFRESEREKKRGVKELSGVGSLNRQPAPPY